jgi:tetratricopeptide (TPR) repeat protein
LPELYERLGDVEQLRSGSVDAYRRALDLCRSLGRPREQQLRVLAGLLICVQRWWEGVGRMDAGELEPLREYGRRLANETTDEMALARFLAADAFYPWHLWRQGLSVPPSVVEAAEAAAQRAVELADRTGDLNTWSAALDGVASSATIRAEWEAARQASRRRLTRQMELGTVERRDAYHMVCDTSVCLGDLNAADRALADAMALDWGDESAALVAILTDQIYVFAMLGRWDDALAIARKAVKLWNETHAATGPANYGFLTAYEIAHARRESAMVNQLHDALLEVSKEVSSGPYLRAVAERDWTEIERMMITPLAGGQAGEAKVERMLATFVDRAHPIRPETIRAILDRAMARRLPLLEAQARRAAGQFDHAIEIWSRSGALPYAARARIELAQSRDQAPAPTDLAIIQKLQDLQYLETRGLPLEPVSG